MHFIPLSQEVTEYETDRIRKYSQLNLLKKINP